MATSLASIILVGLASNYAVPGVYVEVDYAQGPVAGAGGARRAIILANATSAGSATRDTVVYGPDTQTPLQTESDVIALGGQGSQAHRMFLRATPILGPSIPLYFVFVTESGGAQASATMTIANAATANGTLRFWCVDQFIDTTITNGDSVATIAGNVVASINSQTKWPVQASNAAGVITITAKQHGPEGNWIRVQSLIIVTNGQSIATTTSLTANTNLSGGTTADSNAAALATIATQRFDYIVLGDSDTTNVGRAVTQVSTQALPTNGIRQTVVSGFTDTQANGITQAISLNAPRDEIVFGPATDWTPAELAANNAALYMVLEAGAAVGVNRMNFSDFPSKPEDAVLWLVPAGRNGVAGSLTPTQVNSCLLNGLSPITVQPGGRTRLEKRITTRSLNGSTPDYRVRDPHKVRVPDYWADDLAAKINTQFGGRVIIPDPVPGQPVPGAASPGPLTVSPSQVKGAAKQLVTAYGSAAQWSFPIGSNPTLTQTPADLINAALVVQQETNPRTRISILAPLSVVDLADQFALLVQQVA